MINIGYTHARFQPLNNSHFNVFLKILEKYDELWIGIANPHRAFPLNMDKLDEDMQQKLLISRDSKNNPYTFLERYEMIRISLIENGIDMKKVRILPHFAFFECDNWKDYIPKNATIVLMRKGYHHYSKTKLYEDAGWNVEFVEPLPGVSKTIFDKEWPNGSWSKLVPEGTKRLLKNKL